MSEEQKKVLVTDATKQYFGANVISFIEKIAKAENKQFAVVSPMDCGRPQGPGDGAEAVSLRQEALANVLKQNGVSMSASIACFGIDPDSKHIGGMHREVMGADGRVSVTNLSSPTDLKAAAASLSGLPAGALKISDASAKDIRTFGILHEVAHGSGDKSGTMIFDEEFRAETGAKKFYAQALKEGIATDPNVPKAFADLRTIRFMTEDETKMGDKVNTHKLATFSDTPLGTKIENEREAKFTALNEMSVAKNMVLAKIGDGKYTDDNLQADRFTTMIEMQRSGAIRLSSENQGYLNAAIQNFKENKDPSVLKAVLDHIGIPSGSEKAFAKALADNQERTKEGLGRVEAAKNPGALYEASKAVLASGALEGKPYGQATLQRFTSAAETYAPDHFKTAPAAPAAEVKAEVKAVAAQPSANDTVRSVMTTVMDKDNGISVQGSGQMTSAALAQSGMGNTKVSIANPDTGQVAPPQTANAFLQKSGIEPAEIQQQVVRRQEMALA